MEHENGGWMNEEQRAASAAHVHSFAVDTSCDCGIMLSAYVKGLKLRLADLTALREADQATIASLGLVNKELADALEAYLPDWEAAGKVERCKSEDPYYFMRVTRHNTRPTEIFYVSRDEWERRERARAALRSAGHLQEPPQG